MDTTSIQRFKDALVQSERVAIVVGKNPNVDEMAAGLSLYLSLKSAQKAVSIASVSQPIVELSSLVGIDEVKGSIGGGTSGDLVVSFPYQEGEIEKVSYTIENGFLNIVVKAGENGLTFQEQDVRFTRGNGTGTPSLIIVVGTAQMASVSALLTPEILKDATVVNIDNKAENEGFGDIVLVSPQYSSVSEEMANVILSNGLPMDVDIAQNLMLGISFATNNFQSPQTSYFAFEIVAELMRRGAVRVPVMQAPVQTPSFMQPQPNQGARQPQQSQAPRQQNNQRQNFGQGQPRNQQQSHSQNQPQNQNQSRIQQRFNQNQQQRQNNQPSQQNQNNRQDEIRRALAEQARAMQNQNQPMQPVNQPVNQPQPQQSMPQPMPEPMQPQQDTVAPDTAPSDWLTPKVYKGSSNPS